MAYQILSLDGGGSWALLQAMALGDIYGEIPGRDILSRFDLVVANSGGSIVLGGLIENKTPLDIVKLFLTRESREAIFAKTNAVENLLSHIPIFPRYSTAGKLAGLSRAFESVAQSPMSSFSGNSWVKSPNGKDVKLLIVAFDYDALRARFFRSYDAPPGASSDSIPLVQAIHASSNAPIEYFNAPTEWGGRRYWDGAMAGLNNPLLAGAVELITCGVPAHDIVALSIGTGTVRLAPAGAQPPAPRELTEPRQAAGVIHDLGKAAACITDDPPDLATYATHVLLAAACGKDPARLGSVVRLSPVVRPVLDQGGWKAPSSLEDHFPALANLRMDAVEDGQVALLSQLGRSWLTNGVCNQPIRMRPEDLSSLLGEELYSEAKARWLAISAPPRVGQ
jgi:hypothetical protein